MTAVFLHARAVLRDRPVVTVNAEARVLYALSRLAPCSLRALARLEAKRSPMRAAASGSAPVPTR